MKSKKEKNETIFLGRLSQFYRVKLKRNRFKFILQTKYRFIILHDMMHTKLFQI